MPCPDAASQSRRGTGDGAAPEVKRAAHLATEARGVEGAVRDVVELILNAQGKSRELACYARAWIAEISRRKHAQRNFSH